MFCTKCSPRILFQINARSIFLTSSLGRSHYDSLGITPKATQNDIKAAYYKLSMIYHPDKNKGSNEAAEVFRNITTAYEVLGNLKTRRLYDKGILHTAGKEHTQRGHSEVTEQDDAQTRFYKAHMNKSKPPTPSGRTPIFNFDEWTKSHYSESFAKHKSAKDKYEKKQRQKQRDHFDVQNEFVILSLTIFVIAFMWMQQKDNDSYDTVTSSKRKDND